MSNKKPAQPIQKPTTPPPDRRSFPNESVTPPRPKLPPRPKKG